MIIIHKRALPVQREEPWKKLSLLVAHCSTSCCFFAWPLANWKRGSKVAFHDYMKPSLRPNLLLRFFFFAVELLLSEAFLFYMHCFLLTFLFYEFFKKSAKGKKRHCSEQTTSTNWEIKKKDSNCNLLLVFLLHSQTSFYIPGFCSQMGSTLSHSLYEGIIIGNAGYVV